MTTKPFILAGFAMLFILASCSSDDASTAPMIPNSAAFDYYTVENTSVGGDGIVYQSSFTTAHLQDEKFFSETKEQFFLGVGQGQVTTQHYFYENDLMVKRAYGDDIRNFFYDAQGRLIAINWDLRGGHSYYRFVYPAANIAYFEKISLAYNDPATAVMIRYVLEFDSRDNVVKAGLDNDYDGISNTFNTFDYDGDNNLIAIHQTDGTLVNFSYSPIRDNFAQLAINTFGKKNLMVYQAECYVNAFMYDLRQSPNLRDTDTQEALIETQGLPYYFRKTKTTPLGNAGVQNIDVTTFYFR